jgi:hypothetical protein
MRILTCGCCGERAPALKQHWNQDTGFGLCPRCVPYILDNPRAGNEELKGYGTPGLNFAVPLDRQCVPGMLVAWKTLAEDGEYHGYHVGKLKEWDNGTAIVTADGREHAVRAA